MVSRAASTAAEQPRPHSRPADAPAHGRPPAGARSPEAAPHPGHGHVHQHDQSRFERAFTQSPAAQVLVDRAGRITGANPAMGRLLARPPSALLGAPLAALAQGDGRAAATEMLFVLFSGEREPRAAVVRLLGRAGSEVVVRLVPVSLCTGEGRPDEALVVAEDLTHRVAAREERRRLLAALADRSQADTLTGLRNRRGMEERLRQAVAEVQPGEVAGVLVVDVDRFKMVNDSLGHAIGDELLQIVAQRMLAAGRGTETFGRFGSDEFLVVVPDAASVDDLAALARNILGMVMEPVTVRGYRVTPSVSIGIGATSDGACPPEALLCDADVALNRVKQEGGGNFELPPAGTRQNMTDRLRAESDLRYAIDKGELEVHYQPVLGRDGSIVGVEALVRWPHPARGMLLPAEFIPLAEETGLIVPLGNWVLWQATAQVAAWRRSVAPHLRLGVNISAKQLMREGWSRNVMQALTHSGLEPEALCLEITETALLRDLSTLTDAYRELRDAGVRLAIDDFGTGYCSLVYLRDIPANVVKLDRLFVGGLSHDSRDTAIVRSLIQLAHALGMSTVAEGVEEVQQAKVLQRLGCDFFQGFLWSRAVSAAELAGRLESATVWQRDFAGVTSGGVLDKVPEAGQVEDPADGATCPEKVQSPPRLLQLTPYQQQRRQSRGVHEREA